MTRAPVFFFESGEGAARFCEWLESHQAAIQPKLMPLDFTGNVADRSGMEGLQIAEDVTMVCCPDLMSAYQAGAIDREGVKTVQLAMINHCEQMGDRMALIDPLPDLSPQEVKAWRQSETNYDSKYAALYYPWLTIGGPDGRPLAVPPSETMYSSSPTSSREGVCGTPRRALQTTLVSVTSPRPSGRMASKLGVL